MVESNEPDATTPKMVESDATTLPKMVESSEPDATIFPVKCPKFGVALSWDHSPGKTVDIDLQAVAFDSMGKVMDAVYYNNLKALGRGLTHSSDETTGAKAGYDEIIWVEFQKLPCDCCIITFIVAAYSGGHLHDAQNGAVHLLENSQDCEVAKFKMEKSEEEVDLLGALVRGSAADWSYRVLEVPAADGQHFIDILEPTIGNFVRQIIPGAPKRIKACFAMEKGTVVDLPRTQEIKQVKVGLGWDTGKGNLDLDVSAVMLGSDAAHIDTVFFGNLASNGVVHSGDNLTGEGRGDDEVISFDLMQVPAHVCQIVMVVNIFTRGRGFEEIANPYCRVIDGFDQEMCKYMLSEAGNKSALLISRLFREPGNIRWGFQALGIPCDGNTWTHSMPMISHYAGLNAKQLQGGSDAGAGIVAAQLAPAQRPPPACLRLCSCFRKTPMPVDME
eukprot:TRINITY_DN42893_c0_g1_i1.p1 TRINITY_DN42893_c0_g1~~TRINITY_DN42893_c0_g1_i1.p1  ORF type:complete len:446 (-),score=77.19 TRINITY_DN42893_c0_g1_i1:80-1417(-)